MKRNFLKFWLLNVVVFVCCVVASYLGALKSIYERDGSYLTFVIMASYVVCCSYLGGVAWESGATKKVDSNKLDAGWFVSELCLALGMIGTVVGFIQMLQGFSSVPEGADAIKAMLSKMSFGMSTALYTTLAGLIFGNLLKVQCFWLEKSCEEKEGSCQNTDNSAPTQVS